MSLFSEELRSGIAKIRFDVIGSQERDTVVDDLSFLNYRLADVKVSKDTTKDKADIIWETDKEEKTIKYEDGQLLLTGAWEDGELNKIMVTMLANEMNLQGLHPFHSSAVRYRDKTILIVGGENNHGKSMTQLEACKRGGKIISTETTVIDDNFVIQYGSKNTWMAKRAKGTERSDLPDTDEGVAIFFDKEPVMEPYNEKTKIDLAILPGIDGHFKTEVKKMGQFERAYQTHHSIMNFGGLNQLLCGETGAVMPILDTDERRQARGKYVADLVRNLPYYMIRSKTPQITIDEIDKIIDEMESN